MNPLEKIDALMNQREIEQEKYFLNKNYKISRIKRYSDHRRYKLLGNRFCRHLNWIYLAKIH